MYTSYNYLSGDNKHYIQNNMKNFYDGVEKEFEINLGEKYFISSEVEVFQVIFYWFKLLLNKFYTNIIFI